MRPPARGSSMAARSTWKGYLKLSLVSVPVKAYTSTSSGGGEIRLNQLHAECHSRINYKKTCPIHGEVPADQIVSGYEYAKDQYVIIVDTRIVELDRAGQLDAAFLQKAVSADLACTVPTVFCQRVGIPKSGVGRPHADPVVHAVIEQQRRFRTSHALMRRSVYQNMSLRVQRHVQSGRPGLCIASSYFVPISFHTVLCFLQIIEQRVV